MSTPGRDALPPKPSEPRKGRPHFQPDPARGNLESWMKAIALHEACQRTRPQRTPTIASGSILTEPITGRMRTEYPALKSANRTKTPAAGEPTDSYPRTPLARGRSDSPCSAWKSLLSAKSNYLISALKSIHHPLRLFLSWIRAFASVSSHGVFGGNAYPSRCPRSRPTPGLC